MATISVSLPADGESIDASDYNTPLTTIVNEINGNLDNANIKSAAAIAGSKLADASIDLGSKTSVWDGWIAVSDSWTYASATTITVPSDATTKYAVGDKIKLVQSATTKYFFVTAVSSTVLTVTGGTDYTVANSAISGIYYSKVASPQSFPKWFSYTPTFVNLSGGSLNYAKFTLNDGIATVKIKYTLAGAGVGGTVTSTVPVNFHSDYTTDRDPIQNSGVLYDATGSRWVPWVLWNAADKVTVGYLAAADTYANLSSTVPFTWATTDEISIIFSYHHVNA